MANINYDLVLEVFQPLIRRSPALARSASHRVCNTKVSLETSTSSRPYGPSDQAVLATGYHGTRSGSLEAPPFCRSPVPCSTFLSVGRSYLPVKLFSQPWGSLRLAPINFMLNNIFINNVLHYTNLFKCNLNRLCS